MCQFCCSMLKCVSLLVLICLVESSDYRKCGYFKRNTLRCNKDQLGAVPQNIPPYITSLTIKYDDLRGGFTFPAHKRLRKLYLVNVEIGREIPRLAFAKLKELHDLRIQYLPKAGQNLTIHPEAFHGLKKLVTIRLFNLGVSSLPDNMFKDSSKLRQIYITGTNINRIGRNTFSPLSRVQQLSLMFNKIATIEDGAFDCVDETYRDPRIYLSNNELETVPTEISHDKIKLKIHDNPILCDCNLKIPESFTDKKARCKGPADLSGTALVDLVGKTIECVCYPPDIRNGDTEPSSSLQPGATLQIFCSEGYSLSVMPNIVCQEDGTFGDTAIPECIEDRVEPEELEDGSLLIISNAFSVYPNPITLRCPTETVVKSCKCAQFYCQGVVLEDTSCRVYAAPGNATKGELICIPNDLVLDHYTYDLTEDIEHFAACRPSYQMTACTNYNSMDRVATDHGVLDQDMSGICRVDCGNIDCDLYIRCLIIIEKKKCDKFSIYMGSVTKEGVEMTASSKFEEGDVVTITCNEGYELFLPDEGVEVTQTTLSCVEGEIYNPPEIPECFEIIPECELAPIESVVAYPSWTVLERSSITLSCRVGYEGEQEIISCERGGTFNQPQIQCTKKVLAECYVEAVPHATITLTDGSRLEEFTVVEGTVVIVNCQNGYQPSTYRDRLTCLRDGQLSDDMPSCIKAVDPDEMKCSVPLLQNGFVENYTSGDEISTGTVITFQCKEGFKFHNPNSISLKCVSNQFFEPNRLPRCKKVEVRCEVPELENGYYSGYRTGESILLTEVLWPACDYGHDL
ncbi:slit homolog 3 protein-like [Bolinopsis microptera]|uniref:slit homolog 3 protein-like n=1 Tax=Bolinopsis microptera TaxID=2820187 RepID=UPI003079178A